LTCSACISCFLGGRVATAEAHLVFEGVISTKYDWAL
jgi:hypothetical protein